MPINKRMGYTVFVILISVKINYIKTDDSNKMLRKNI